MLYDHTLTIGDEYKYVWKAKSSITKYTFLIHRYVVPCVLLAVINESCGFNGFSYTNRGCQVFLISVTSVGITSLVISSFLVLRRVLALWNGNKNMRVFLFSMYVLSMCVTITMTFVTFKTMTHSITWSVFGMCRVGILPKTWIILWGAPTFFEVIMVTAVIYNSVATPRSAQFPLRMALQNDGIIFFMTVLLLRLFNMLTAAVARSTLALIAVFFMWSSITTAFNRSLLRLRRAESRQRQSTMPLFGHPPSQYGLAPEVEMSSLKPEGNLARVEVETTIFKTL